jgi:hypothetical protein
LFTWSLHTLLPFIPSLHFHSSLSPLCFPIFPKF